MLQVIQHLKSGELSIEELPTPNCRQGGVLVQTAASLISAGTERTSVSSAQSSLIERARQQPEQVKQLFDMVKKDGLMPTVHKVLNRLDSFKTLGYSASGVVIESRCDEFSVGDRVACAGAQFAHHAEYISVPKNLVARLPDSISLEDAAYTTVGSIALQGVRQADVRLGETVVVIGLGLLGQLTVQLLKASGCRVIGLDINESLFERAMSFGCDVCLKSSADSLPGIAAFTRGIGSDAVIITASTISNEPIELSMKMLRKKGKVVIVGVTGMDIPRSPFYEKEIDIRISCSYGPGRYDPVYEEGGIDYPAAFVRWTENRNMQAFLDCIASGTVNVKSMTTHRFSIQDARQAYDLVTGKNTEASMGIVLGYPERAQSATRVVVRSSRSAQASVNVGLIGAGSFAQSMLLPPLKAQGVGLVAVSTSTPANAHSVAHRYGFGSAATDSSAIIENKDINFIICATPHSSHAAFVLQSLQAHKSIFVEKPLCINREQLSLIDTAVVDSSGQVMVGFNRRFSAPLVHMKKFFEKRQDPLSMLYRVNAGFIPKTHWIQAPEQGGRIIGEACHMIDCMVYLSGALPVRVYAESIGSDNTTGVNHDNVSISVRFSDGSIGTVHYFAGGDAALGKEYFEAHAEQRSAVMDNFKTLSLYASKKRAQHSFNGTKGHAEEINACVQAIKNGTPMPISYEQIRAVTVATFAAEESLSSSTTIAC